MKIEKTFDTLKDANNYKRDLIKRGYNADMHSYKVKQSYRGINKTFFRVTILITDADLFRELMDNFNSFRTEWIKQKGSDIGFNDWFTNQVISNHKD